MAGRTAWGVATVVALVLTGGCAADGGPTSSQLSQADLHLDKIVVTQGADQSAHEGDTLPELVVGELKLNDGSHDYAHAVRVSIRSGNGRVFVLTGGRASGDGATLVAGWGSATVGWILGSADEPQVLRIWALGQDTVYADVHATVLSGMQSP